MKSRRDDLPWKDHQALVHKLSEQRRAKIMDAALECFSTSGFRGTTLDQIAGAADVSKANLVYHFKTKETIYRAILDNTLQVWMQPLDAITDAADPIHAFENYIRLKMKFSAEQPLASKLYCHEILSGAPNLLEILKNDVKDAVDQKIDVIQRWIDQGRLIAINPYSLLFAIWASTQHFADFSAQVEAISDISIAQQEHRDRCTDDLISLILNGIRPRQ